MNTYIQTGIREYKHEYKYLSHTVPLDLLNQGIQIHFCYFARKAPNICFNNLFVLNIIYSEVLYALEQ